MQLIIVAFLVTSNEQIVLVYTFTRVLFIIILVSAVNTIQCTTKMEE